ncbi:MAG: ABC transporter ATP-binding protein [Kiritimatiellaeota bacterium]|nr:ABC transporter ATP-binding protein [Kiritimatiellota bacterium]
MSMSETREPIVSVENAEKAYRAGAVDVPALRGVSLVVNEGDFLAIAGPSGSGKTTLLNLVGGLDVPTRGTVRIRGRSLADLTETERSDLRRDHIGFVFQFFNLVPVLTVAENVEYVLRLQRVTPAERRERVREALEEVGLAGLESRRPAELSGGQQQRVAVARALVSRPDLILADEPTANLDSETGADLVDLMHAMNRRHGTTFVFSSHDRKILDRADRLIRLRDGRIVGSAPPPTNHSSPIATSSDRS